MLRLIVISGLLALISLAGKAQDTISIDLGGYPVKAVVQGNDTILIANLGEAVIRPNVKKPTNRDMRQYRKLVYNVKKVYPYAKLAGEKFAAINAHMDSLETKREQREYIKQV